MASAWGKVPASAIHTVLPSTHSPTAVSMVLARAMSIWAWKAVPTVWENRERLSAMTS